MTRPARTPRLLAILVMLVGGCSGPLTPVAPLAPPSSYSTLGRTQGSACGFLFYSLIPIFVNDRTERAYDEAVSKGGAEFLIDTEVIDRWYYAGVGLVLCTTVAGTGARRGPAVSIPSTPMLPPASRAPALEMRGNQAVKPAPPAPSPPSAGSGVLERFRALKAQHDSGQLSDTEYETKRQQLSDEVMQGK
jgi:hypothetical protein